ncbi:MAG TPA: CHASE3 domain-containing protein, partial [Acidobacteriaceae bacterium]|nr:CHASE3 domain-containing protein [Acidobacteriaceae bacterium]
MSTPIEGPLRRRVTIGFVVAVLLTIFLGFSSWRSTRMMSEEADWVAHTYAVMERLELTEKHVIEAETGARIFALMGQESLLVHYRKAQDAVAQDEAVLRRLTADNPNQLRRLDVLESQVHAGFEFAARIVTERGKTQAVPDADEILETERLMAVVRTTTEEMHTEEARLLSQRTERTNAGRRHTHFVMAIGVLVGVGCLVLAGITINREIGVSMRARAQIGALNAELEGRVEQRTAALQSEIAERRQA